MKNFKFNEKGRLIIDFAWFDLRYPTRQFVMIDGEVYSVRAIFYKDGHELAKALEKNDRYVFNKNAKGIEMFRDFDYLSFFAVEKENTPE